MYKPNPIETGDVVLDSSLVELTEKIAKNVHENWAQKRLEEGWSYGPLRNEVEKITPCLVPYESLPEEEKEYDRCTAMETIKLIVKLGYKIEK